MRTCHPRSNCRLQRPKSRADKHREPSMRLSAKPHATAILMLLCVSCVIVSIAAAASRVHGVVSDASGGVLPGVTVVATNDDGQVVASAVTDGVGEYSLTALSAGPLTITYELDG